VKLLDRVVLAVLSWRLRRDPDNGFLGAVTLSLASRLREQYSTIEAQKAVERCTSQIALRTVALDNFANLEAGEVARQ
jgi:hypothetical protein